MTDQNDINRWENDGGHIEEDEPLFKTNILRNTIDFLTSFIICGILGYGVTKIVIIVIANF